MAQIDNIVQVQITRQTTQVDITSFDIPLLLVEMDDTVVAFATDRVRTYTSIEGVADDLGSQHQGYKMATKLLGGQVKPNTFKIGKVNKQGGNEETYVEALLSVIDYDDTWYAVITQSHLDADIDSVAATVQSMRKMYFTSTSSQLAYTQSQSVTYTATVQFDLTGADDGDTVSVVIAGERYQSVRGVSTWGSFSYVGSGVGTFGGSFAIDAGTGLLTITNATVNYVVSSGKQTIALGYTGLVPADDVSITDPVGMNIGQRLREKGYDRTTIMFSNTADSDFPEAAWVGGQLPATPGSNTWEYKSLPGVTVSRLTDTQITILEARGYNYYIPVKGVNITRRGKVAAKEWVD